MEDLFSFRTALGDAFGSCPGFLSALADSL